MPAVPLTSGAKRVIINEGDTPFDRTAHLRFREKAGLVLLSAINAFGQPTISKQQ